MKRDTTLTIRLTPNQKRQLKQRADTWEMTLSELVRHLILSKPPRPEGA